MKHFEKTIFTLFVVLSFVVMVAAENGVFDNTNFNGYNLSNIGFIEASDWSNVTITESQVSDLTHTVDTHLTQEQVEDYVGGMTDGTETHISVTYNDAAGNLNYVVSDDWYNSASDVIGGFSGTCNSTTYLAGDGSCGAPAGGSGSTTTTLPASNITDWPVETPSGNIFLTRVQGANNTARVFDSEASTYNANNITSGILPIARINQSLINTSILNNDVGFVTKVGTPVNNQLGIWTGDGTIEGSSALTYTGSLLTLSTNIDTDNNDLYLGSSGLIHTGTGSAYFGGGGDTGDRLKFDGGGESIQWENFNEWYMPKSGDVNFQRWSESGTTRFVAEAGGGAYHNVYTQNNFTVGENIVVDGELSLNSSGTVGGNSTCLILYSPDGGTTLEVCN